MKNRFKILLCCIIPFFTGFETQSQSLQILWQQCYGGSGDDLGYSVIPSSAGYFLFGGTTSNNGDVHGNHGNIDFWLVSIDSTGNILNSSCFGGSDIDGPVWMNHCLDGGYILTGATWSNNGNVTNNHGGADYWLVRTDENGNIVWKKCFGGSCNDELWGLSMTSDSGYLCCGVSCSNDGDVTGNHGSNDYWVAKVDKNGNLKWEKSLGGSSPDWGGYAAETNDGGAIVGGWTGSTDEDVNCQHHGNLDAWMVKLDSSHNIEWQKCYGGSADDVIDQIIPLDDGTYLFRGFTLSSDGDITDQHGNGDFWVGKTDPYGNLLWNHCYGGGDRDEPFFMKQVSDGGYILGGYTLSNDGEVSGNHSLSGYSDMWFIKISPDGTLIWEQCFGGEMDEILNDAVELPGHKFLLFGGSSSDNWGDVNCFHHGVGTDDFWLVMVYDSTTGGINDKSSDFDDLTVYPNPASDFVKFAFKGKHHISEERIQIINEMGEIIKELILPPMTNEITWDTSKTPAGVYCYFYYVGDIRKTGKIVIIK
ncbi:MAG: T9SS type A sorting domain-containing protein [Bacteroidota bacterium]